ncbi:hypothetical protein [Leifsonia aquatica]|uniref:hypothetical protein n=1 Tax=Leifsonia aquatica TaxID=144185 RepID=UPI0004696B6B|nr:hypothetical protein [Leifsonia aquatica]
MPGHGSRLDRPALVIVDVQKGFDDAAFWGRGDNPRCETNIAALLAHWRRHSAETLAAVTATNLHGEFATVVSTAELLDD